MSSLPFGRFATGLCAGIALVLSVSSVFGGTITVVNTQDSGAGSLRDAIASAVSGDTISFNVPLPATIFLDSPLTFVSDVTVIGPGAPSLVISPQSPGNHVVLIINAGSTVSLSRLTI